MDLEQYIAAVKAKLADSPIIVTIEIVDERILLNRGYFRARFTLTNSDFVEIAESFAFQDNQLITLDYRYQWMDASKKFLRKRWDSVKHFPDLPNFPHHVHIGSESNVEPGLSRNIPEFIGFMESELG
ncbi:toxin-antitoxin system TumE family protein [Leptothermofonsia sp. ETS-13]|uniref:toxin-antitoxin system TumE family protein n=1 Tax=Leptothermofonsia sp. ETS-13 TaxID=3035696 RepID=UPI003B9F1F52